MKLRTLFCIIIFCGIMFGMNAQVFVFPNPPRDISKMSTVDSGKIKVWYVLNAIDIKNEDTYDDWQCLEIGSHLSKYYSYFIFRSDSLCTDWGKKNPKSQSAPSRCGHGGKQDGRWSEYFYTDFFKDFSNGTLTQYTYMPRNISHCQYVEDISVQNWILHDDTITVAGYLCQKAVCVFRGRTFEAWFTMSIPIRNGPWKFGGLPGLILKIYDLDKLYVFEFNKLEIHHHAFPIKIYNNIKYEKMDRNRYRKLVENINKDYFKISGWTISRQIENPPYHPLELE